MIKNDYNYQIYLSTDYTYSQVAKIHLTAENSSNISKKTGKSLLKKAKIKPALYFSLSFYNLDIVP